MSESILVSQINYICKERSLKWPKIKIECDWLGEEETIVNFYDTTDISQIDHLLDEIKCSQPELNSALEKAYENGDTVIVGMLLDKGADAFHVLNEKYNFFDYERTSITVELINKTDKKMFEKKIRAEFNEKSPSYYWTPISFGYLFGCYASIRKFENEHKDDDKIIQSCRKLRKDIASFLSMVKDVASKPLPGLRIPGDFKFVCPLSFQEMLADKGDKTDSKFARLVVSFLEPGTPFNEY